MSRKTLIAFAAVLAAVIVSVVLLVTGGTGGGNTNDPSGDVTVSDGVQPPPDVGLADILVAEVRTEATELVFEAEMEKDVPRKLPKQALSWRWEVYEDGQMTWLVSANVDLGPNASLVATQNDFFSSTVDDTLPGQVTVDGSKVTVRIRYEEIDGFPQDFEWLLKSMLDGSRVNSKSAIAEDQAPDGGYQRVDG